MDNKIKIIYCITKSVWGGAGKYVYDLATALPKNDFETLVVLGGKEILAQKLKEDGIKVVSLSSLERNVNIFKDFSVFLNLLHIFREEKPNVIHLNSSKIGGIGALAGKMAGVPKIIFTAHGWPFNENRNLLSKVAIWIASWITVLLSTDIITINSEDYKQARKMPFASEKIKLIFNGIKTTEVLPKKNEAKELLQKKLQGHDINNKIIIGSIAELHNNKGLIYALRAISLISGKILEEIIFVIIGDGEERERLEFFVKNNELQKHVAFAGFQENAKNYLPAFDIFLIPSLKEGLPYVLLEAGLAGVPVIATTVGGIPDLIDDEKTGLLISPKNPDQIKSAIIKSIGNLDKMERTGRALRDKIILCLDFKNMLEKTINLYKSKNVSSISCFTTK